MDKDGLIRTVSEQEPLRPDEVEISDREERALARLAPEKRHHALAVMRQEKPKTKGQRTSGMPKHKHGHGDNPNRGKKKGRRG
jgi:hypothetical protein